MQRLSTKIRKSPTEPSLTLLRGVALLAALTLMLPSAAHAQQAAFNAKVNFSDAGTTPPAGYLKDFGEPYGDRGNGSTYGWIDPQTGDPVDLAGASNGAGRNRSSTGQSSLRLATLIHMDYPLGGSFPNGRYPRGNWEMDVPNGTYEVTVAAGDASVGSDPEVHSLNVEGVETLFAFAPSGNAGSDSRHATATVRVGVTDGKLTVDYKGAPGTTNTKINYIDIAQIVPEEPFAFAVDPANYATDVERSAGISANVLAPGDATGVDISTLDGNARLFAVNADGSNGTEVPGTTGSSGGNDVINFDPNVTLAANTMYRFVIDGVESEAGDAFLRFSSLFTTGTEIGGGGGGGSQFDPVTSASFDAVDLGVDGVFFTTLRTGPDGKLYGATNNGQIRRYNVAPDGTLSGEEILKGVAGDANPGFPSSPRVLIGMAFDPASTPSNPVVWTTHTTYGFDNVGDRWGGKVSRLSGPNLENVRDVFVNLPRSAKDHLTNSIEYGPDGRLYFLQGSNLAAGAPDNSWGSRPETKLTAAVLVFDPANPDVQRAIGGGAPVDVKTDEPWNGGGEAGANTSTGNYDPFAPGAPLQVYATGIRNAYDLVWHSNGELYVPTNGTAAGGQSPSFDPNSPPAGLDCAYVRPDGRSASQLPAVEGVNRSNPNAGQRSHEKQRDFLFRVEEGGYYGHPNPSRCEWALNNGNLTSSTSDPGEGQAGSKYDVGTQPDPNYRGWAWDYAFNVSPNGVIEYQGDNFGREMTNRLLVVRFSNGNDIFTMQADPRTGEILGAQPGNEIRGFGGPALGAAYNDPLELAENPATGDVYLAQYDRGGTGQKLWLLRPTDRTVADTPILAVDALELIFSGPQNETRQQTVSVTNTGTGSLQITGTQIAGTNAGVFSVSPQAATLLAGQSQSFTVTFDPNATGPLSAALGFQSNGGAESVGLYGLSAPGYYGIQEPTLQDALATLGYNGIDVGWSGLAGGTSAVERGDEAYVPLFQKAGFGNVTITPVARYSPAETLPFGWYSVTGGTSTLNEVGTLSGGASSQGNPEDQTLFPPLASGSDTFDPGNAAFGLYTQSNVFGHVRYTEDARNSIARGARIYALTNRQGQPVPNSYLVGFEDASNGDYQDYVFVLSNVEPAGTTPPVADLARINAGGPDLATSLGDFSADAFVTGSSETSSKSFNVAGTDDDDLYLTYRYGANSNNGPGGDFGYAVPVENGAYVVKLHFLEPYFGAPGGGTGGTGQRIFSVDVEGGQGVLTNFDLNAEVTPGTALVETFTGVTVSDGTLDVGFTSSVNNAIISAIEVIADEPTLAGCAPYSTLDCAELPVGLPYSLGWSQDEGGLADGSGTGTGFTLVAPPSARFEGSPTFPNVEGYEPGDLTVATAGTGTLTVNAGKGIFFREPSASTQTNSQINALAVGIDASEPTTITARLSDLPAVSGRSQSQQAGLWFGLGEDDYVKLVTVYNGGGNYKVQLGYEAGADVPAGNERNSGNVFGEGDDVVLKLELDPVALTATGFYSADGGATFTQVEAAEGSVPLDASLFAGIDHDGDSGTEAISPAGVLATTRRANAGLDFSFDAFDVRGPSASPVDFAVQLTVSEVGGDAKTIEFGTAADADASSNDAYDQLRPPPAINFDAYFACEANNSQCEDLLSKDYRATITGGDLVNWVVGFQREDAGRDVRIDWSGAAFPEGSFRLVDNVTGGIVNVDMKGQTSYTVTNAGLSELLVVYSATSAFEATVATGWNMVGLPLEVADASYQAVFADVQENSLFRFNGAYQQASTLEPGEGYWLKFSQGGTQTIEGADVRSMSVSLTAGWNMVSGPSCAVERSTIGGSEILESTPFYGFDGTYQQSTTLEQGEGYWIKASTAGQITLDCAATPPAAKALAQSGAKAGLAEDGLGVLVLNEVGGASQRLFVAGPKQVRDVASFATPPLPPSGVFDARFEGSSRLTEAAESRILLQRNRGPVLVRLERTPQGGLEAGYMLEELVGGRVVATHTLQAGVAIEISSPDVAQLRLRVDEAGALPDAFALKGNYPNPFNPSTTIVFDLPQNAEVEIEVFNALGRRVMRIPAQTMTAGAGQKVRLDASHLASGTYLYRISARMEAQTVTKTGRMVLVK